MRKACRLIWAPAQWVWAIHRHAVQTSGLFLITSAGWLKLSTVSPHSLTTPNQASLPSTGSVLHLLFRLDSASFPPVCTALAMTSTMSRSYPPASPILLALLHWE